MDRYSAETAPSLSGHFACLRFDRIAILVEKKFISSVVVLEQNLLLGATATEFVLDLTHDAMPVVVPDDHFNLLATVPAQRRMICQMQLGQSRIGIACTSLQMIELFDAPYYLLPPLMQLQNSPARTLLMHQGEPCFYCDGPLLFQCLTRIEGLTHA